MVNAKPFVIEYPRTRVLTGYEIVSMKGEIFSSIKEYKEQVQSGPVNTNIILFCPACGVGHRMVDWGFPVLKNRSTTKRGQCPNCGERVSAEYSYEYDDLHFTDSSVDKGPILYDHAGGSNPAQIPSALKWWPVEDGKLAIEVVNDLYYSRTMYGKYWLQRETLRYRYIFNLKTGQSYMMTGIDRDGKPHKLSRQKRRLQNYTFTSFVTVPNMVQKDFLRVVLDALVENKRLDVKALDEEDRHDLPWTSYEWKSCSNFIGMHNINQLNYFADMKSSDIADMLTFHFRDAKSKSVLRKLISLSQGEVEWLPKYMQKRSIRHRLNKRTIAYFMYKWMYQCGIRDVNIMNNVVDTYIDVVSDSTKAVRLKAMSDTPTMNSVVARCCVSPTADCIAFMKWALRGRTAESACNFIKGVLSSDGYMYSDSARMLKNLPESVRPEKALGNLKDVHDELVIQDRKWRFGNREIDYTDAEKALEIDLGEYSFRLPKDTDTLYDIGKKMGICVGSYGRNAVAKNCTILTVQKDEKYVACVELRVRKKDAHMVQLKSKYNHTVTDIEPIVKWVEQTGVNPQCRDYQNAIERKVGDFDRRNHDYHVENPRLIGQNVQANDGANWNPPFGWDDEDEREYAQNLPF